MTAMVMMTFPMIAQASCFTWICSFRWTDCFDFLCHHEPIRVICGAPAPPLAAGIPSFIALAAAVLANQGWRRLRRG
jgi:hypothetical protein